MIDKSYITYEVAVGLKMAGFNKPVNSYYDSRFPKEMLMFYNSDCFYNFNDTDCGVSAPKIQDAEKWVQDHLGYYINISPIYDSDSDKVIFNFIICDCTLEPVRQSTESYETKYQAINAALSIIVEL